MAEESHEKVNQNLNQRMKTIVWRKTGPARRVDLPWSKAKIDLQESRTLATKNGRISLAEMSITRLSFNTKEKQDQKLVPIYKFICLNVFVHCKHFTSIPFTLEFRRNF